MERGILERRDAIAACERVLDGARHGAGGVAFVAGPAGIGKSAVLREAGAAAGAHGVAPLRATGSSLARDFAFGAVLQLVEPALPAAGPQREDVLAGTAALARPLLEGRAGEAAGELSILHGLYRVVAQLAAARPLALVVDDAHWADAPSLRFLLFLAQRIGDLPVALLVAARPGEPGAPAELLREIAGAATHVQLEPLSAAAVAALVRAARPEATDAFCAACGELSGGNPFLLGELLEAAGAGRLASDDPASLAGLTPAAVRDGVLVRLARLGPAAAAVAEAVAVLGAEARTHRAARLAEAGAAGAATAIDALVAADILRAPRELGFVHPLLGAAVHRNIPAARRELLHRRAARLLADEDEPAATVAGQLLEAGGAGDPWAVERLRAAATEALARGAPASAVRYLRRALSEPAAGELRAPVLVALAEAEAAAGEPEAVARLEEALKLVSEPSERAQVRIRLGWMLHKSGRLEESADTFARGLHELGDAEPALADALRLGHMGAGWQVRSHADAARRSLDELLAQAGGAGDSGQARWLIAQHATLQLFQGARSEEVAGYARRVLGDGALIAEEGADSLTLWHAVGCLSWCDRLEEAEAATDAAIADARRRGTIPTLAQCFYARAWPRYWSGRVDEAVADAEAAVEGWRGGWGYYLPGAVHWLVLGLVERGDLDAAARALEVPELEARWGGTTLHVLWLLAHAHHELACGRADRAREAFTRAGELGERELLIRNPAIFWWRSGAALAASALGDSGAARALAAEELEAAKAFGAARPLGAALRVSGVVERGRRGAELTGEAVAVLERSPSRLELLRALVDHGALLRSTGQPGAAREPLRRALDVARACPGAIALRERAHAELLAAGGRPRRDALTGVAALTPSERRVCTLAAAGLGNREIAEQLFVSRGTVEFHLGRAFRKLGIASRAQLAGMGLAQNSGEAPQ